MAFIYRYQLRESVLRRNTNLRQYSQDIQSVLNEHYNINLKDSTIEVDYFEFKLYKPVPDRVLQKMGRKLKAELPVYGFVRMEQTLYALVFILEDGLDNIAHIELIDSMLLDKPHLFIERANSFFEKNSDRGVLKEKGYVDNIEEVIKNYYIDIFDAYIDKHLIPKSLKSEEGVSCFFIKGFHKHKPDGLITDEEQFDSNMLFIENCFDIGYVNNRRDINNLHNERTSYTNYLKINESVEHPELIERIKSELKLYISSKDYIDVLNREDESSKDETIRRYVFKVHDVGQALAISLSNESNPPFLYFDYGMPYGRNSFTRPASVNMPTNPGTTIIISHVDKDHWFRIADDINAYQCHWYVPDQPIRAQLNHKFAEVIVHGGSVNMVNKDIAFHGGKITCGGISKINPSRAANNVHETGLTMRIEAHDFNGKELNILIAGDQRYDYIDQSQLENLDILVASHHGGEFCWSKRGMVPIAKSKETSIVIYSYGRANTHKHPSKVSEYNAADWQQVHSTCRNSDFEISIAFLCSR